LPPQAEDSSKEQKNGDASAGGFSIVPREKKLRIGGNHRDEPSAGFGGFENGRLLIPLEWASSCARRK